MKLGSQHPFLVLKRTDDGKHHRVAIVPSRAEVLRQWTASTRISPLFGLTDISANSPEEAKFKHPTHIVFLGPIHPEKVLPFCGKKTCLWLTLGLFNILFATTSTEEVSALIKWLKKNSVAYEKWLVKSGVVQPAATSDQWVEEPSWRNTLQKIPSLKFPPELGEVVQEYCPLMASALARSHPLPPAFANDLRQFHDFVEKRLLQPSAGSDTMTEDLYKVLGRMAIINAGLSRFAAQTFSGTTRITETECHYWSHSLLGVGTANTALWRIQKFLREKVGEARLHLRFKKYADGPNEKNLATEDWPEGDFLGKTQIPEGEKQPVRPLLAYFSSRDGFRSTDLTISVPLSAVSGCNSPQWSLMTITHEVSHVVIRAILSDLYPSMNDPKALQETISLLKANAPGKTVLLEVRRIMLFAIHEMERVACGRKPNEAPSYDATDLHRLLAHWRPHVEETLVHVFDFLYFYGRDVERYVRGIWISWGTIPNLSTRVHSYVQRTICAIMSTHLRRGAAAADLACKELLACLKEMKKGGYGGRYVIEAIHYIEQKWDSEIKDKVEARRELIKIAVHFLFSESIATKVLGEAYITGGQDKKHDGYDFRPNQIELKPLSNPLHFLKVYTGQNSSSPAESAWVYHILAFCVKGDD